MVERAAVNRKVIGSIPIGSDEFEILIYFLIQNNKLKYLYIVHIYQSNTLYIFTIPYNINARDTQKFSDSELSTS